MVFKVATYDTVNNIIPRWWNNFYESVALKPGSIYDNYHIEIAKHNAVHPDGLSYIEFDSEEDYVIFRLKVS